MDASVTHLGAFVHLVFSLHPFQPSEVRHERYWPLCDSSSNALGKDVAAPRDLRLRMNVSHHLRIICKANHVLGRLLASAGCSTSIVNISAAVRGIRYDTCTRIKRLRDDYAGAVYCALKSHGLVPRNQYCMDWASLLPAVALGADARVQHADYRRSSKQTCLNAVHPKKKGKNNFWSAPEGSLEFDHLDCRPLSIVCLALFVCRAACTADRLYSFKILDRIR